MTSLPERTPQKTLVASIVALLSNGRKQACMLQYYLDELLVSKGQAPLYIDI
jgi:hypothetical protein